MIHLSSYHQLFKQTSKRDTRFRFLDKWNGCVFFESLNVYMSVGGDDGHSYQSSADMIQKGTYSTRLIIPLIVISDGKAETMESELIEYYFEFMI